MAPAPAASAKALLDVEEASARPEPYVVGGGRGNKTRAASDAGKTATKGDAMVAAAPATDGGVTQAASGGIAFDPQRIERILVEEGLITQDQISRAQRIQSRLEEPKSLATIVTELGWISQTRIEAALRRHRKELSIEEILVEKGSLRLDQLKRAEEAGGAQKGQSLGRFLVESGAVTERDYLEAYCEKFDLPFVEADATLVDPDILVKVSLKYLKRHRILPLSIRDGKLNLLLDDLQNQECIPELERLYGHPVSIGLSTRAKLNEALNALTEGRDEPRSLVPGGSIQYHKLADAVESDRVIDIVDHIILKAIRDGASDIHIEPMESKVRVRLRIDGSLVHVTDYPKSYCAAIISRIKVLAQADVAEHRMHQDGRVNVRHGEEEVDLRASFYVTVFGENAVLRVLRRDRRQIGLEEMGFSPSMLRVFVENALEPSSGIVLVVGPTGSGKTTTLYAAVDRINDPSKKIITCEDPVEYVIEGITQCSIADRPGINFEDSLKAIVRQDPDVILIGEIRDRLSAEMAIQSALPGHKVLSTFHTEDTVGALLRLMDMQIETFLIASTVTAVLAQRLVRRQCRECRDEYHATPREMRALSTSREELAAYPLTKGRGCPKCLFTGYKGRMGVYELLMMTDPIRDAILSKKPSHEIRRLALEAPAFMSLQEDCVVKCLRGESTFNEALENVPRAQLMRPLGRLLEMYE